jgi:Heparinase II/III-like protein/Heparinase II/III N-terminus
MLEIAKRIETTMADLMDLKLIFNEPFLLTVTWEEVRFDFYIRLKENSKNLFVFGNGAYNSDKMSPPVFQRHSWVGEIEDSVIIYNDPTLYLGKINIGWGQGTAERFYLKDISEILEIIIKKLNIDSNQVVFYGSSAGGFMSLYLGGLIKGSHVLVNNPQIIVSNYYQSHVHKMYECSYPGLLKEEIESNYLERLSIIEFYKKIKYVPNILYLQNLACKHDVQNHLTPFLDTLKSLEPSVEISKVRFDFYYNEEQGHNPLDKSTTLKYINSYRNLDERKIPSIEINNIDTSRIIKISEISSETINIAEKICNNQFYFFKSLDLIDFSGGINWDYQHPTSPQTYQLYLQALNVVSHLLNAFEKTNDIKYLLKAYEIVESWINYECTEHGNSMVWYDHPTAYRAHNLVYFLILAKKYLNINEEKYIALIEKHAKYLYSDENYRKNNHGIMMDRALIMLGIVLGHQDSPRWIQKGIWRLKDTFYSSYSKKGVHLENSPEYHRIVRNLYLSTERFLNQNNLSLGKDLLDLLTLSDKYFSYITKPDGFMPMIGDSGKLTIKDVKKRYDSFHDQTAGISILQWRHEVDEKLSTWLSFICGYGTTTHKHYDDLSITLYYNGNDIFIDSGKYSYGSSKIRGYILSPSAHTTLALKDKRYKFDDIKDDHKKIYTSSFMTNNKLDFVKGINKGYEGVTLERSVLFLKPNLVVILDNIQSNKIREVSQIYNLAPHIEIKGNTNYKVSLQSKNDIVEIEQLNFIDETLVHQGNTEIPRAVVSEKFGEVIKTNQLEFTKRIKDGFFLTVVKLGKDAIRNFKKASYDKSSGMLMVQTNNEEIKLYI